MDVTEAFGIDISPSLKGRAAFDAMWDELQHADNYDVVIEVNKMLDAETNSSRKNTLREVARKLRTIFS